MDRHFQFDKRHKHTISRSLSEFQLGLTNKHMLRLIKINLLILKTIKKTFKKLDRNDTLPIRNNNRNEISFVLFCLILNYGDQKKVDQCISSTERKELATVNSISGETIRNEGKIKTFSGKRILKELFCYETQSLRLSKESSPSRNKMMKEGTYKKRKKK